MSNVEFHAQALASGAFEAVSIKSLRRDDTLTEKL